MIEKTLKQDDMIMKLLSSMNVDRINRVICNTNQGALELEIRKGERDYHFVLGAVPLNKELSKELMNLLYPLPQMEKPRKVDKGDNIPTHILHNLEGKTELIKIENMPKVIKRLGRPRGAKTGVKMD